MAAIPIPATAPRRRWRALEEILAERDALAAEVAVRGSRAAVREAHHAWVAARSEAERRAAAAQYRQLVGDFRSAERAADQAWRRFCRILDDR
jgi:hypothetical protein